jgi:hypothetical protein
VIETTVRCFRRKNKGKLRRGVWLMTRPDGFRGMFVHGDRDDVQAPEWSVEQLAGGATPFEVEEITPEEAVAELAGWPDAVRAALAAFERHPKGGVPCS